jgi:hypothetical protein
MKIKRRKKTTKPLRSAPCIKAGKYLEAGTQVIVRKRFQDTGRPCSWAGAKAEVLRRIQFDGEMAYLLRLLDGSREHALNYPSEVIPL